MKKNLTLRMQVIFPSSLFFFFLSILYHSFFSFFFSLSFFLSFLLLQGGTTLIAGMIVQIAGESDPDKVIIISLSKLFIILLS